MTETKSIIMTPALTESNEPIPKDVSIQSHPLQTDAVVKDVKTVTATSVPAGPLKSVPRIYKYTNGSESYYFTASQLPLVAESLFKYVQERMVNYRCGGCHWWCYGKVRNKKWCEATFTSDDFKNYFEFCRDLRLFYRIQVTICEVVYTAILPLGYSQEETLVWEFDTDNATDKTYLVITGIHADDVVTPSSVV